MKILVLDIEDDWYTINGVDPRYKINILGDIVSTQGHLMSPQVNASGYDTVRLVCDEGTKTFPVHVLVATTFISERPKGCQVNHKDGNKRNNHVDNLEWVTQKDNLHHAMDNGLHAKPMVPVVGVNKKTGHGWWFRSTAEAGRFGFTQPNVSHCLSGRRATCKGYNWSYA